MQWKWSDNVIETCSKRYTVFYVLLIAVVLTACGSLTQSDKPVVTVIDAGSLFDPLADELRAQGLPVFRSADRAVRSLCKWIDLKTR